MARGDHLKQYWFKPGCAPGPGRPPSGASEKEVRRYTREHVAEVVMKVMDLTDDELNALLADKETPQFEKIVARVMLISRETGDMAQFDKILERAIGKVPQKIEGEFTGAGGAPLPPTTVILQPVKSEIQRPADAPQ